MTPANDPKVLIEAERADGILEPRTVLPLEHGPTAPAAAHRHQPTHSLTRRSAGHSDGSAPR